MADPVPVVVVQWAFDDPDFGGRRNNPACEERVAVLIGAWAERLPPDGGTIRAGKLAPVTAANLNPELGRVVSTLGAIAARGAL